MTTAAESLSSKLIFPEFEVVRDDEFVRQPNFLKRSQSAQLGGAGTTVEQIVGSECLLPSLDSSVCGVKTISASTIAALLRGEFRQIRYIIADCRYDYEYAGGHIKAAINVKNKQAVDALFQEYKAESDRVVVIFHCEFSKHRGPNCCRYFRQIDREANAYPALSFPNIFVMDGGYKKFYQEYPDLCDPNSYVSMWDPKYSKEFKESQKEFKQSWRIHKSKRIGSGRALFRTQSCPMENPLREQQFDSMENSLCTRSSYGKDRRSPRSPGAFRHLVLDLRLERKYFSIPVS